MNKLKPLQEKSTLQQPTLPVKRKMRVANLINALLLAMGNLTCNAVLSANANELTPPKASSYRNVLIEPMSRTAMTDMTIRNVQLGMNTMPDEVLSAVAAANYRIVIAPASKILYPSLADYGGLAEPNNKRCLIFEKGNPKSCSQGDYIIGVTRHELGHMLDNACGLASHSPSFVKAVRADEAVAPAAFKQSHKFCDDSDHGRGEVFACLVNQCCTPTDGLDADQQLIAANFPRACAAIIEAFPSLGSLRNKELRERKTLLDSRSTSKNLVQGGGLQFFDEAISLANAGQHGKAVEAVTRAIAEGHAGADTFIFRGEEYERLSEFDNAARDYTTAIDLNRNRPYLYERRAACYSRLHNALASAADLDSARRFIDTTEYKSVRFLLPGLPVKYTTSTPDFDWIAPRFDDSAWSAGVFPFGTSLPAGGKVGAPWTQTDIYVRGKIKLPRASTVCPSLRFCHDDSVEIYADGQLTYFDDFWSPDYHFALLLPATVDKLNKGEEVVFCAHCHNKEGVQNLSVELVELTLH